MRHFPLATNPKRALAVLILFALVLDINCTERTRASRKRSKRLQEHGRSHRTNGQQNSKSQTVSARFNLRKHRPRRGKEAIPDSIDLRMDGFRTWQESGPGPSGRPGWDQSLEFHSDLVKEAQAVRAGDILSYIGQDTHPAFLEPDHAPPPDSHPQTGKEARSIAGHHPILQRSDPSASGTFVEMKAAFTSAQEPLRRPHPAPVLAGGYPQGSKASAGPQTAHPAGQGALTNPHPAPVLLGGKPQVSGTSHAIAPEALRYPHSPPVPPVGKPASVVSHLSPSGVSDWDPPAPANLPFPSNPSHLDLHREIEVPSSPNYSPRAGVLEGTVPDEGIASAPRPARTTQPPPKELAGAPTEERDNSHGSRKGHEEEQEERRAVGYHNFAESEGTDAQAWDMLASAVRQTPTLTLPGLLPANPTEGDDLPKLTSQSPMIPDASSKTSGLPTPHAPEPSPSTLGLPPYASKANPDGLPHSAVVPYDLTFRNVPRCQVHAFPSWHMSVFGVYQPMRAEGTPAIPLLTVQSDWTSMMFGQGIRCAFVSRNGSLIGTANATSGAHLNGHGVPMNFAHHMCPLAKETDFSELNAIALVHKGFMCPAVKLPADTLDVLGRLRSSDPSKEGSARFETAACVGPVVFKNQDGFAFMQWLVYHLEILKIDHIVLYLIQLASIPDTAAKVVEHYHKQGKITVIDWSPLGDAWSRYSWCYMQPAKENDCLHRFRYRAKYLLYFDPDEFLELAADFANITAFLRTLESQPDFSDAVAVRWRNKWHSTALEEGLVPGEAPAATTLEGLAQGHVGALVSRMPNVMDAEPDVKTRHKFLVRPEKVYVVDTHQVLLAKRYGRVLNVPPDTLHHNHFHHLNDGWYNTTDNWITKRDTSWGERHGPALEKALISLARNLTANVQV